MAHEGGRCFCGCKGRVEAKRHPTREAKSQPPHPSSVSEPKSLTSRARLVWFLQTNIPTADATVFLKAIARGEGVQLDRGAQKVSREPIWIELAQLVNTLPEEKAARYLSVLEQRKKAGHPLIQKSWGG